MTELKHCPFCKAKNKKHIALYQDTLYDMPDSFLPWYAVHKDFNRRNNCKYYESKEG